MPATAKVINLKGNPNSPEPATHIITFPGGSIELSRTSENDYWVHMAVYKGVPLQEVPSMSRTGNVIDTRIDRVHPSVVVDEIPDKETIEHIAIRIRTSTLGENDE